MVAINVCIYEKWIKPSTLLLCLWLIWHRRVIGGLRVHWSAETPQSNDGNPPPPQGSHHWVNGVNFACIGEKKQKFWWLQPQKCSHIWDRRSDIYSLLITKWTTTSNLLDNWQACWFNTGTGCWVCRNSASLDDPQKLLFCWEELAGVQLTNLCLTLNSFHKSRMQKLWKWIFKLFNLTFTAQNVAFLGFVLFLFSYQV